MPYPALPILLIALAAPAAAAMGQVDGVEMAQLTIRERVIIRVPRMGAARAAIPAPIRYKEKKGPKCVAAADLGGALIQEPGAVDLVMAGGKRLRARLDKDCGPLDYYGGFYLRPAADGQVCGGRDVIRMRSGASCGIAAFKTLVPAK